MCARKESGAGTALNGRTMEKLGAGTCFVCFVDSFTYAWRRGQLEIWGIGVFFEE